PEQLLFAVNAGVVSRILLSSEECPSRRLRIEDCHWRQRVLREGADADTEWWVLGRGSDQLALSRAIVVALRAAVLPAALAMTEPLALRKLWLSGESPGLTEAERLMALVKLLAKV